jgi:murein DD-endopeptidase MepM/ murein hydrolase activator NlpD
MKKFQHGIKIAIVLLMTCILSTQVFADNLEDAQQDKDEAEENKNNAESILKNLEAEKSSLEEYVQELDDALSQIQADIADLNEEKADLEADIADKQEELETAKQEEQKQYEDMCARIQFMYENDTDTYADALLSSDSMSDFLNRPEYVSAMAEYDYNMLDNLISVREQVANDELLLEMDLQSVENLTAQAEQQEEDLNTLIEAKAEKIAAYEDQITRQEQMVAQYDAELQAAAARIAELEANVDGNFVPYAGGALVWPCPSSTRITSYFGYRTPDGGYVNDNHKGVDIGAPTGTPAVAAASGVVVIARYSNSAGNWVVISHGNGMYTMYMHASQLCVSEGQYVNAGDTILLVGSTGWSTGPHLHFGVGIGGYLSANAVDPLNYFR